MLPINTYSYSYTQTRAGVLDIHFELFLRCANIPDKRIKKILQSVDNRELSAVGIYLESGNCRIAEVEFRIDWEEHQRQVNANGELFDTECPGWKDGVAPEAYILVQRLCERAKEMELPVRSWIRVSPHILKNPAKHRSICDALGYNFGSSVPPWKTSPVEKPWQINYLSEATAISREVY